MGKISKISAHEVLQATGRTTVEAELLLDDGKKVKTSVPSDETVAPYQTKPIETARAVSYINDLIAPKLKGVDAGKQFEVDAWLVAADKTPNREKLGVNTIWAISSLLSKGQAASSGTPLFRYLNGLYNKRYSTAVIKIEKLPSPIVPMLWRADHEGSFDFKEFCFIPSTSQPFTKSVKLSLSFYNAVKGIVGEMRPTNNYEAFEVLLSAISSENLKLAVDIFIGLNFSAQNYYQGGGYDVKDKPQPLRADAYLEYVSGLVKKYFPLFLIDPLALDDLAPWRTFNETLSKETYLVGGDLVASSAERFKKILEAKACSSIIIKPAQMGTITEVIDLVSQAKNNNVDYILSSSDFETGETLVADLATAVAADFVKFGPLLHEEDISKYNRMSQIEREINKI